MEPLASHFIEGWINWMQFISSKMTTKKYRDCLWNALNALFFHHKSSLRTITGTQPARQYHQMLTPSKNHLTSNVLSLTHSNKQSDCHDIQIQRSNLPLIDIGVIFLSHSVISILSIAVFVQLSKEDVLEREVELVDGTCSWAGWRKEVWEQNDASSAVTFTRQNSKC